MATPQELTNHWGLSDHILALIESGRIRSSTLRINLLVCSAKLRVKIYNRGSLRQHVESKVSIGIKCIPYAVGYELNGQSILYKEPERLPS